MKDLESAIKRMFLNRPFGRILLDRKVDDKIAVNYEWEEILKYSREGVFEFEYSEGELVGLIGFHVSQYDTDIFKKRTAIVKYLIVEEGSDAFEAVVTDALLNKFNLWVKKSNIEVAIARIDSSFFNSILALQKQKYCFYETITYKTLLTSEIDAKSLDQVDFRFASIDDLSIVKKIALKNTFRKSHFYLDPEFSETHTDMMYANWIDNSFKSNDRIIVVEENTRIVGAFIYDVVIFGDKLDSKRAIWKSAFIDGNFRKKGLGKMLFGAALKACINEGVASIDSSLIVKNIPSQNLHTYYKFKLVSVSYTFHRWFHK